MFEMIPYREALPSSIIIPSPSSFYVTKQEIYHVFSEAKEKHEKQKQCYSGLIILWESEANHIFVEVHCPVHGFLCCAYIPVAGSLGDER